MTATSPRIPSVTVVIELEASPRLVIDCATERDKDLLRAWVREVRPETDHFLRVIAAEIRAREAA